MFKEECGQCRRKQAEALALKTRLNIERDETRQLLRIIKNLEKSLETEKKKRRKAEYVARTRSLTAPGAG
jgi:hypothetical protein